jgi:hypothetical protein
MQNQLMSHKTNQKIKQKASTEYAKSAYVSHKTNQKQTNKKATTEHAKSGYVTLLLLS